MEDILTAKERGRILIVDDEPSNLEILTEALEDDYDIMCATSGHDALEAAREELPDLILLDVMMPEMDGYQVCSALKADPVTASIPVIFLTGLTGIIEEAKGLEIGAADYISKPISIPIVRLRIGNHMKLTRALAELEKLATTDGLTKLANRRHMDLRLKVECSGKRKSNGILSVILLDIDHFKVLNDTYGHQEGDDCLKRVSKAIISNVNRKMDLVARYGGEEFFCILPSTIYVDAMNLAEKIRLSIENLKIPNKNSPVDDFLTISLGVVTILPDKEIAPKLILGNADKNLYRAKESGRNRIIGKDYSKTNLHF